jgi:hypothetical protein
MGHVLRMVRDEKGEGGAGKGQRAAELLIRKIKAAATPPQHGPEPEKQPAAEKESATD